MLRHRGWFRFPAATLILLLPLTAVAQDLPPVPGGEPSPSTAPEEPAATECDPSRHQGQADAATLHSTSGWFLGGIGSGLLLGPIGLGIITVVAAKSHPTPETIPPEVIETCYTDGYTAKARSKNTQGALFGSLVGVAVVFALYYSAGR